MPRRTGSYPESAIHAGYGNHTALAARLNALAQCEWAIEADTDHLLGTVAVPVDAVSVRLHSYRIYARIGSTSAGHFLKRLDQVRCLRVIDDVGSPVLRHPQPLRNTIDADHLAGAQHLRASDRKLTNRSAAPDCDDTAVLDVAVLRRHVAGGEDVAQEEHLLIFQVALDLQRPDVGERDASILRLSACVSAVHVRVTEQSRTGISVKSLSHMCVGVTVIAQRPELLFAIETIAAGDGERNYDSISHLDASLPPDRPRRSHP